MNRKPMIEYVQKNNQRKVKLEIDHYSKLRALLYVGTFLLHTLSRAKLAKICEVGSSHQEVPGPIFSIVTRLVVFTRSKVAADRGSC
jgi:hypothetical protein